MERGQEMGGGKKKEVEALMGDGGGRRHLK